MVNDDNSLLCIVFNVMVCISPYLLVIVLCVLLRFMAYDYPFDIFKLSFPNKFKSGCGTILVSHVDEWYNIPI